MESGEAAALEPVGHDGAEEAELGEVEMWLWQMRLDPVAVNQEVSGFMKSEDLAITRFIKAGEARSILRLDRALIDERVPLRRHGQDELWRALERQVNRTGASRERSRKREVGGQSEAKEGKAARSLV
jgi:hypothetical protein